MAFHVTKEFGNGYRCGCCHHTWESDTWFDTLEEALEEVPVEWPEIKIREETEDDDYARSIRLDTPLEAVSVVDGATGKEVAWAKEKWSSGYGRGSGYKVTEWYGERPDVGAFSSIYRGSTEFDGTWEEAIADIKASHEEYLRKQAQRKKEEAEATLKRLNQESS